MVATQATLCPVKVPTAGSAGVSHFPFQTTTPLLAGWAFFNVLFGAVFRLSLQCLYRMHINLGTMCCSVCALTAVAGVAAPMYRPRGTPNEVDKLTC